MAIATSDRLFHIARDTRVQSKLRFEVAALDSEPLRFELIKSMSFSRYIFDESEYRVVSYGLS